MPRFDFPISQVFIRNRPGYHFACKGGHNAEAHNHNDVGSFVLIYGGEYVLDDPGWPEYDKWYFGEKRYTDYICAMSEGHSLPIIDGQGQKPSRACAAKVISADADEIVIDLSAAYAIEGVKVVRAWRLLPGGVELRDTITGAKSVVERIMTRVEPAVEADGTVRIAGCELRGGGKPAISTRTFVPRLVSNTGMKPVETLYLIDFPASNGKQTFSLIW